MAISLPYINLSNQQTMEITVLFNYLINSFNIEKSLLKLTNS